MSQRDDLREGGPRAGMRALPPETVEKAEVLPRQALEKNSKMLDKEHVDTLYSKHRLALTLY